MSLQADGTGTLPDIEDPEPRAENRWFGPGLAAVTVLGLLGRWIYLVTSKVDQVPTFRQGDAFWYSTTATNLGKGKLFLNAFTGTPTADHPPLTVLVLGPASFFFRESTYAQRMTMVVLGAATIAVMGLAGRRLAGPRAGLVAAGLTAVAPVLWVNDVLIMSETITSLVVALVLWAGIALSERPTMRLALVAGLLCGLAALSRAETGLFLPFMVWPLVARARGLDWRRRLQLAAAATAATAAVIAPWTALNLTRFQEPVAISTNDGLTLIGANCDTTYFDVVGGWNITPCASDIYKHVDEHKAVDGSGGGGDVACDDPNQHRHPCWDSSRVSKLMRQEATSYIRHHLGEVPRVLLARNGRVWGVYQLDQSIGTGVYEGRTKGATTLGFWFTWALLPVSAVGVYLLHRRRVSVIPFVASLLIVVVVSTAFYGLVRFRLPYDLASCLLGGVVVAAALDRYGPKSSDRPASPD